MIDVLFFFFAYYCVLHFICCDSKFDFYIRGQVFNISRLRREERYISLFLLAMLGYQ